MMRLRSVGSLLGLSDPLERVDLNLHLGNTAELQIEVATILFDGRFEGADARDYRTWRSPRSSHRPSFRHGAAIVLPFRRESSS
jgi:hypothetical protein